MAPTPSSPAPTLPTLETDCYLLETDDSATGALQSLTIDHLLLNDGDAYWVDAAGHARADTLARLAPSKRLLERIQVARGFTAYQHAALATRMTDRLNENTALVVVPAIDALYRRDESRGVAASQLLRTAVEDIVTACNAHEIPLLLTCTQRDAFSTPVAEHVDTTIRCEATEFGPRFVAPDVETLVYPVSDGYVQTTLAFWRQVLADRATAVATPTEVTSRGAN